MLTCSATDIGGEKVTLMPPTASKILRRITCKYTGRKQQKTIAHNHHLTQPLVN